MKIRNSIYTVTLCFVFGLSACGQEPSKEISGRLGPRDKESLSNQFRNYWNHSKEGNSELGSLISLHPTEFFSCQTLTELECAEKLEKERRPQKPPPAPNEFELSIEPSEMVASKIPDGIRKGFWRSFDIGRARIAATRGRLEITVQTKHEKLRRDVLFIKGDEGWKIFEIVDPGEIEAWAPIIGEASTKVPTQL